jgi:hypothetical protein
MCIDIPGELRDEDFAVELAMPTDRERDYQGCES